MVDDFDMTEIRQIFIQESLEGLDVMESGLLNLDLGAADPETMNSIFRAAHSIKGGGATFGFVEISEFTHHVETLLDRMRKGESPVTEDAVQVLLQSVDCMRGMIDCLTAEQPIDTTRAREVQAALQSILDGGRTAAPKAAPAPATGLAPLPVAAPVGWLIDFQPHPDMFRSCNDPLRIFRELGRLGDLKVECFGAEVLDFATLDPESCHLAWHARRHRARDTRPGHGRLRMGRVGMRARHRAARTCRDRRNSGHALQRRRVRPAAHGFPGRGHCTAGPAGAGSHADCGSAARRSADVATPERAAARKAGRPRMRRSASASTRSTP